MKLSEAKGEKLVVMNGEEKYLPLFLESELERAETIVAALKGIDIESAQSILKKVNNYLLQSTVVI